jgi:hypothetical protein
MCPFREFSSSDHFSPPLRNIDNDAPEPMRQELVDLIFHLVEQHFPPLSDDRLYRIVCQSLGVKTSGQPYAGYRHAVGRDIAGVDGLGFTISSVAYDRSFRA